jgi:phosphoribosylformylglycinamidine cyclo-ligase
MSPTPPPDRDATGAVPPLGAYAAAGVNLRGADDALRRIGDEVRSTYTPNVLAGIGAFGGLFAMPDDVDQPVLVASTDGVGTKTMIATALGRFGDIGRDLVNHCVNDILVQGARPLFFLDYVASSRLDPEQVAKVVHGVASACRDAGMALLGGETAEMPGVYTAGELDLVGTIVGVVSRPRIVDGSRVRAGDVVLGLGSGGLQTNGFSLARLALGRRLHEPMYPGGALGETIGDALMSPHRSFLPALRPLLDDGLVRAAAHVTGGGLPGNVPRVLPEGLGVVVDPERWRRPAIFDLIQREAEIDEAEMRSVFNLGVGMVVIVAAEDEERAHARCPEPLWPIGRVESGQGLRFQRGALA